MARLAGDPSGARPATSCNPARESATSLGNTRRAITAFSFAAQYQQNPMPLGGAIVKTDWLRFYEPGEQPADFWQILQSWDTANKSGELTITASARPGARSTRPIICWTSARKRLNFPDLKREVARLADRYRPHTILIEDKASGTQLIQDLSNEGRVDATPYSPPAGADKIMRLHAQTALFENGKVLLPKEAPWLHEYVAETTGFPGSRYADQVDSTTQALDYLRQNDDLSIWARLAAKTRRERLGF